VEYYGAQNQKSGSGDICHFGVSGTNIPVYISKFKREIQQNIKIDSAIFYLYQGNDFADFINSSPRPDNRYEYPNNRKLTFAMRIVKSSYAMNIISRELLKPMFLHVSYNE